MKILFAAPAPPFPTTDGARLVVAQLARQLASAHTLYFAGFADGLENDPELRAHFADVELVTQRQKPRAQRQIESVLDPLPALVRLYESAELRAVVREMARKYVVDVVHLDMGQMALYANAVAPTPTALAPHDSLTRLVEQRMTKAATAWARTTARLQFDKLKRYESTQYAAAQRVVVVSEPEKDYLEAIAPGLQVRVVANGVDTDYFAPMDGAKVEGQSIGMHGVMEYPENEQAALWFAGEILPRIWRELPDVKFTVIGRNPTSAICALAEAGRIEVTGTVVDVRPYVAAQAVMVVPMVTGGGIKNKLLEAMAMGKPIVATPEAAEGIATRDGDAFVPARGADEFAAACVRLLRDADERARLGNNARVWTLEHGWKRAAEGYLAVYQEAIDAAIVR